MEKLLLWIVLIIGAIIYEQIKERIKKKPSATAGQTRKTVAARPRVARPTPPRPDAAIRHEAQPHAGRHTPLVIPEQADTTEDTTMDESATASTATRPTYEEEQQAREAHYARWRQAIIDTQIIERKF